MQSYLIAPSILSADFARLGENISQIVSAGADLIHFDVMDNHYVPNLTAGPMILKALRNYGINIPIDVHLMTSPVDRLISDFASAGANYITFHLEATNHIDRSLQLIKTQGCKVGLAFNPATPLNCLEYVLDKLDIILLMSVNPGLSGQDFLPSMISKIRQARCLIDHSNYKDILIEVDGGIKINNIASIARAGANIFVTGSAMFKTPHYGITINAMRNELLKV